jgi:hypothetical protein
LGNERAQTSTDKCFYYINENRNLVNYDFHLRLVFSTLKLNKDNIVSLFVNEPCEKSTVLPNIISILETFEIHQDELNILKNCNFSLKISKSYLNEYEEIKELISAFCKDSSRSEDSHKTPKKLPFISPPPKQLGRIRKNLSQSLEIMEYHDLEDTKYNLSRLLPPEKRFTKAVSDKSRKNHHKRRFPGSKGPTLKRPLGVFSQMRKRALINTLPEETSEHDLSLMNQSILRRVLKEVDVSSQKTKDLILRQSGRTSQKSLTVKQTYSERKFNDFLARHRDSNRESDISFDQSARFTKKAKKSFCFKTIHSKLTNGFKKKLKKTFSLRSLNTRALRTEQKEPSYVPLDAMNLNDLTYSFVQRESDRRKSFITVPHGQDHKPLMSITQESDSEKSVQSLQTRPYRRRSNQHHYRSEDDFDGDFADTGFLKDLELMKDLDEEMYLNYMQQHLDYYEFLGGKESMAILGHDFSKKQPNIDKINLKYRRNEHYYLPKVYRKKSSVSRSKSNKKHEKFMENNSKKTKKNQVKNLKSRQSQLSVKASIKSIKEKSIISSKKQKKRNKNKKKQPGIKNNKIKFPNQKDMQIVTSASIQEVKAPPQSPKEIKMKNVKVPYNTILPQDSKPIVNSNVNTISWILKDSDTKLGSLVKDISDKESNILGLSKTRKGKFVESQKVVITEGLNKSQKIESHLKVSTPIKSPPNVERINKKNEPNMTLKQKKKRKRRRKKEKLKEAENENNNKTIKLVPSISINQTTKSKVKNEKFDKFASDLFIPKKEESELLAVNHAQNNLLSSTENLNEKIIPIVISEQKIDQLNLLSEKSETEKVEKKQKPIKTGEKKKRKRRRKKRKKKKKTNTQILETNNELVIDKEKDPIKSNEIENSLKMKPKDYRESQDKKLLDFVSEFDQLTDHSQSEKMKVLKRGIEEFSKGTRPISPENDMMYNRLNTDEKLLSLLALSKENDEIHEQKKQKIVQLMGDFEEFEDVLSNKNDSEMQRNYLNMKLPVDYNMNNLKRVLQENKTKEKFRVMGDLENEQKSSILQVPFFEKEEMHCGLLSELMDEIEDRQKFHPVEHFYLEKSPKVYKIVIIDPDLC